MRHFKKISRITAVISVTLLLALFLLTVFEVSLRAGGYGYPTSRFVRDGVFWVDNPAFARRFFPGPWLPDSAPTRVPINPQPDSLRVAVLGESAAYGYPDPAFGIPRMLQAMLEPLANGQPVEVINAAQSGVNSHVLRETLRDTLPMRPDVIVLYMGNNEFIGPYGAGKPGTTRLPHRWLVRAQVLTSRLRMVQWVKNLVPASAVAASPMECQPLLSENPLVQETYARFERNVEAMVDEALAAGVQVILCTVASNQWNWEPFSHIDGESAQSSIESAMTHYVRARELRTQDTNAAEAEMFRAVEQDSLRYRITPNMNSYLRNFVRTHRDDGSLLSLADCDDRINFMRGLAGDFYDHCHLTWDGNTWAAYTIVEELFRTQTAYETLSGKSGPAWPVPENLASRLGWTSWHKRENLKFVRYMGERPPYTNRAHNSEWLSLIGFYIRELDGQLTAELIIKLAAEAAAAADVNPSDMWLARNAAQLALASEDPAAAIHRLQPLMDIYPYFTPVWTVLARAYSKSGEHTRAAAAWRSAIALSPNHTDWRAALANVLFDGGDYSGARVQYEALAAAQPSQPDYWWKLGQTHEREGNYPSSIAAYREGLLHVPTHPGLHYYLAKALLHEGQHEEAKAIATAGLQHGPDNEGLQQLVRELESK